MLIQGRHLVYERIVETPRRKIWIFRYSDGTIESVTRWKKQPQKLRGLETE